MVRVLMAERAVIHEFGAMEVRVTILDGIREVRMSNRCHEF